MTGLINMQIKLGAQFIIGATGALAVFVIVYVSIQPSSHRRYAVTATLGLLSDLKTKSSGLLIEGQP